MPGLPGEEAAKISDYDQLSRRRIQHNKRRFKCKESDLKNQSNHY